MTRRVLPFASVRSRRGRREKALLLGWFVALLMSSLVAAAQAKSAVQLRPGAYVPSDTPCAQASNSVLMWWNGRYFSQGRMSNVFPKPTKNPRQFTSTFQSVAEPDTPHKVTITISGPTEFTWKSEYGSSKSRYCSDKQLPVDWRHMTPR